MSKVRGGAVGCLVGGLLLVLAAGVSSPSLSIDTSYITLSRESPSTGVSVTNVGGGTLTWTAASDRASVTVTPSSFSGNTAEVVIVATDFTEYYTARVTFTSADVPSNFHVVYVAVTGDERQITWVRTIGEPGGYDEAVAVEETRDESYVVGGYSSEVYGMKYRMYFVKFDARGDLLWERTLHQERLGEVGAVLETTDGALALAGSVELSPPDGNSDIALVKSDLDGNVLWEKSFGGPYGDGGDALLETADGGFVIAGWDTLRPALIKTDGSGNLVWQQQGFGVWPGIWHIRDVKQTRDGSYVLAGSRIFGHWGTRYWYLAKVDAAGNITWEKTFGFEGEIAGIGLSSDGGFVVGGWIDEAETFLQCSAQFKRSMHLVKLDVSGNVLWDKSYGDGMVGAVTQTSNRGFIVIGWTYPPTDSIGGLRMIKTDSEGNVLWENSLDISGYIAGVQQTADGGYILAGSDGNDILVVKTDSNGHLNPVST